MEYAENKHRPSVNEAASKAMGNFIQQVYAGELYEMPDALARQLPSKTALLLGEWAERTQAVHRELDGQERLEAAEKRQGKTPKPATGRHADHLRSERLRRAEARLALARARK